MKELYRHMFACPAVSHQGMWTIDAGSIAVGRYFNLNPVQSWAPNFVQMLFKPFKHSNYSGYFVHVPYIQFIVNFYMDAFGNTGLSAVIPAHNAKV